MNISMGLQEIIAQIRNDMTQIKLYTDNVAMLTEFLQVKGMEQNFIEFAEQHPEILRNGKPAAPSALLAAPAEPAPAADKKGRRLPTHTTEGATVPRNFTGSHGERLLLFAKAHGGKLDINVYREYFHAHKMGPPSFARNTIFGTCYGLRDKGLLKQHSSHLYTLTPKGEEALKLAGSAQPEPVAAPAAIPAAAAPAPRKQASSGKTSRGFLLHAPEIIQFAKQHGWIFRVQQFREQWTKDKRQPPTYTKTTIFTDLRRMAEAGIVEKTGRGEYRLLMEK